VKAMTSKLYREMMTYMIIVRHDFNHFPLKIFIDILVWHLPYFVTQMS